MPTDPIQTIGADTLYTALVDKVNPNTQKRHWLHVEATDKTPIAVTNDTEFLLVSASTVPVVVDLQLATVAPGQRFWVWAAAADVTNTITITPSGSDTVGGAATKVLDADDEWVELMCDGVSDTKILHDGT